MKDVNKNYNGSYKREKQNKIFNKLRNSGIQRIVKNIKNSCGGVIKGTIQSINIYIIC
jgi:hypothetical protein